jgi:hypothetical protein
MPIKDHVDHTWETIWNAETTQKAKLSFSGTQIGSGSNKSITIYIPMMKLIDGVQYSPTQEGFNPQTMKWNFYKASSNPTGMSSTYPYLEIINTLATSVIA